MTATGRFCLTGMLAIVLGLAQSPATRVATEFEVASVKPQKPVPIDPFQSNSVLTSLPTMRGGPGTVSPGQIHYSHVTLRSLIIKAYDIYPDQIQGPGWLTEDQYAVDAVVPSGATQDQFRQMLQNLLVKRFRMSFHWEERDFKVHRLVVATSGSKLKGSAVTAGDEEEEDPVAAQVKRSNVELDSRGCPVLSTTRRSSMGHNNCTRFIGFSIPDLIGWLQRMVANETGANFGPRGSPAHIADATGLSGRFDFSLDYDAWYHVMANAPGVPAALVGNRNPTSIFKVIEAQLGLKLEPATAKLKVMVIEQVERTPTEN